MTVSEIITNINGFTESQIAEFNLICENKVYNKNQSSTISQIDIDLAEDTANEINSMSQDDISNNVNGELSLERQLSGRPC